MKQQRRSTEKDWREKAMLIVFSNSDNRLSSTKSILYAALVLQM
jgi:hypothetical protein